MTFADWPQAVLTAECVPGAPRHPTDDPIRGGEAGSAVGESSRHVLGVRGEDEERSAILEHDARVHETARARTRLVRDLGAEGQLRGETRLEFLPREDIEGESAELRRGTELGGHGLVVHSS